MQLLADSLSSSSHGPLYHGTFFLVNSRFKSQSWIPFRFRIHRSTSVKILRLPFQTKKKQILKTRKLIEEIKQKMI